MEDWIQVIIMIAAWVLTVQQSRKKNKRKKRLAELRKVTVNPAVVLDGAGPGSPPEAAVLQADGTPVFQTQKGRQFAHDVASQVDMAPAFHGEDAINARRAAVTQSDTSPVFQASYGRSASAAPPTPVFQTVPDGVLGEVYAQQSGTPPSLVDVSLSEYAQEATGAHATLVSPQPTLAQSGIQQSFNAYKQPTSVRERRRDSTRSVGIASSAPQQSEQYRDTEDLNFDLRQAIIYSEILTPKYKDYF